MRANLREKSLNSKRLITGICLSFVLSCSNVYSEEFLTFKPLPIPIPYKTANTVQLDTSQINHVQPKANTSIPFKLRDFNESDYFSSSIDELTLQEIEDSEIQPVTYTQAELKEVEENEKIALQTSESMIKNINSAFYTHTHPETFTPTSTAGSFFAPLVDPTISEMENEPKLNEIEKIIFPEDVITPAQESVEIIEPVETFNAEQNSSVEKQENNVEEVYTPTIVSIDSEEVDLNGKLISSIKIEGVDTVKEDFILSNINSQKTSLYSNELLQKDLQKIYSTGYFTEDMSVEPVLNPDDTVSLVFTLKENILVSGVTVEGNTVFTDDELNPFVSNMKDLPQNLIAINQSIDKITQHYHDKGYILAKVESVDENENGELVFKISEGVINKIDIEGNERTKDYVISRNIMSQPETVYNEEILKKDLAKIFSTQVFEDVTREIKPNKLEPGTYNITVIVKEKITNSVALGGGIDTGLGAFGSISLKEDNFLGNAQRVSLSGILGSGILLSDTSIKNHMNYQIELNFFEPYFLNADNSLMSKIYFRELGSWGVPLAIERRIGASVGVEHKVKRFNHLSTSLTGGIEHIHLKEGDASKIQYLYDKNNLDIAHRAKQLTDGMFINIAPGIKYSNLDSEENPRNGIIAQARYTEAFGLSDFNHTHGRITGAVTKFIPVRKKSTFSITAKAGAKLHGDEMPEIMAYRLGGPYSIRGYRINGVGSGESFLMGSAELATPLPFVDRLKWDIIKNLRLTFFVDAGKVFDPTISNVLFDRPAHAITAGIGLRIYIPGVGPISVDYGLPITNPGSYGSEHGYFTFGTGGLNMYNY